MDILQALSRLDPDNDEHWTTDGSPRMSAVGALIDSDTVTRADVTNAAPSFTRETSRAHAAYDSEDIEEDQDTEEAATVAQDLDPDIAAEAPEVDVTTPSEPDTDTDTAPPSPEPARAEPVGEMEGLQAELEERTAQMLEAQHMLELVKKDADRLSNEVNDLNSRIGMLQRSDPNHDTAGIRAYIHRQNLNRVNRAKALQRVIKSTGAHPADIASAVDPRAPIDRAMATRKPARGSKRPVHPRLS